ncbi:MAG TPA: uridine diphosphate-N-acetylglucosamine-binding protein YvcK [Actinomycetota bacterium]
MSPDIEVAALGGGHGLSATLTALRLLGAEPTAVVAMADDGGSSGRLRRDLGLPPPGDLRMALLALADPAGAASGSEGGTAEAEVAALFGYRFDHGELAGHSLGNLVLAALSELRGGFMEALDTAHRLLHTRGRVLPSTLVPLRLSGQVDGQLVEGQAAITTARGRVEQVWLDPPDAAALPEAVAAVERADLVLLGPGSTFTSVVSTLLVPELGAAVAAAAKDARVVYLCNLDPQSPLDETSGFPPEAHLAVLLDHCPGLRIPLVLCQRPAEEATAERETHDFAALGARVLHADLADHRIPGRHDPARLAVALKELG